MASVVLTRTKTFQLYSSRLFPVKKRKQILKIRWHLICVSEIGIEIEKEIEMEVEVEGGCN